MGVSEWRKEEGEGWERGEGREGREVVTKGRKRRDEMEEGEREGRGKEKGKKGKGVGGSGYKVLIKRLFSGYMEECCVNALELWLSDFLLSVV